MPDVVGLCPVHLHEFYAPHGGTCPQCQHDMAEYVPVSELEQLRVFTEGLQMLLLRIIVERQVALGPAWAKRAWSEALEQHERKRAG